MGNWGPGNFDSDGARDYLDNLLRKLVEEIEANFAMQDDPAHDFLEEYGEFGIIPAIDIYITLAEKYGTSHVSADMAARWRRDYLQAFDEDDYLNPSDFKPIRRKVVVETFDKLDALIASQDGS